MSIDPTGDPALRDPFFAELRRRHPDVDIVILPQPPVPAVPPATTSVIDAQSLELHARGVLEELIAAAGTTPAATSTSWWRQGPTGAHRFVARCSFTEVPHTIRLMRAMYDHLEDVGWHVWPDADPRPRFGGERGPLSARVDAYPTAVELELLGEVVFLDAETVDTLEGRR